MTDRQPREPHDPRDDQSTSLDDGAALIDALLGFRAALTATGATDLESLRDFLR